MKHHTSWTLTLAILVLLAGCAAPPTGVKSIAGAKLGVLEHSVVVISNRKFLKVGPQSDVPVPKGSEIASGLGKVLEGEITEGAAANLVMKDAATGAVERTMKDGEWVK